jgi:hypothetical protein
MRLYAGDFVSDAWCFTAGWTAGAVSLGGIAYLRAAEIIIFCSQTRRK